MDIITQLITAFLGALGFSILFKVDKDKLLMASFGGLITWTCYILCGFFTGSDIIRYFLSASLATVYAEFMARKYKTPAAVFLVPATIPMIPGGSLYQTFVYAMEKNWEMFSSQGLNTILLAVAISGGILSVMTIMKMHQKIKEVWKRRQNR